MSTPEETPAAGAQHSPAPTPKTMVKRRRMFTPMAIAISRLDAPARTSAPSFVRATSR